MASLSPGIRTLLARWRWCLAPTIGPLFMLMSLILYGRARRAMLPRARRRRECARGGAGL